MGTETGAGGGCCTGALCIILSTGNRCNQYKVLQSVINLQTYWPQVEVVNAVAPLTAVEVETEEVAVVALGLGLTPQRYPAVRHSLKQVLVVQTHFATCYLQ